MTKNQTRDILAEGRGSKGEQRPSITLSLQPSPLVYCA
nr:MAG TPA: hypothetical protein [Caudoviricetes sp.]